MADPRPTIRFLTPADMPDISAILAQYDSGLAAYCLDFTARPWDLYRQESQAMIEDLFLSNATTIFGYFTAEGALAAFCLFYRWPGSDHDITLGVRVENRFLNLPRSVGGKRCSEALIDVLNYGVAYYWSEGATRFWSIQLKGQEDASIPAHPACILNAYKRELMADIPAGQFPPPDYLHTQYRKLSSIPSQLFRYTDPLPLADYLKATGP